MAIRILLLGKNGQVGWELQRSLAPLGEVTALGRSSANGLCGDLLDLDNLRATVRTLKPHVIVNAGAYTAVDKAESEEATAFKVNAEAPDILAKETASLGGWLIHYSTDYVFDGSGSAAWTEDSSTGPVNTYGRSKLAGEEAIRSRGCKHLIFRTSWVYGSRGNNFAKTMLKLARERALLKVVNDQHGTPAGADLLADVTAHAVRLLNIRPDVSGTYHLTSAGTCSWYDYACFVLNAARGAGEALAAEVVEPVSSEAFPTAAVRPHNSRLDTTKLERVFDLHMPHWQEGVNRMLKEVLGSNHAT